MSISLRIGAPAFVPGGDTGTGDSDGYRNRNDYNQEKQDPSTHRLRRRTRKAQAKTNEKVQVENPSQCAGEGHQRQRHPGATDRADDTPRALALSGHDVWRDRPHSLASAAFVDQTCTVFSSAQAARPVCDAWRCAGQRSLNSVAIFDNPLTQKPACS